MGEAANRLRQEIATTRSGLEARLDQLEQRARQTIDPRGHVKANPWKAVSVALSAGVALGLATGGRRPSGSPVVRATADTPVREGRTARAASLIEKVLPLVRFGVLLALELAKSSSTPPSPTPPTPQTTPVTGVPRG